MKSIYSDQEIAWLKEGLKNVGYNFIQHIATETGLARGTVSKFFNDGSGNLTEANQDMIYEVGLKLWKQKLQKRESVKKEARILAKQNLTTI